MSQDLPLGQLRPAEAAEVLSAPAGTPDEQPTTIAASPDAETPASAPETNQFVEQTPLGTVATTGTMFYGTNPDLLAEFPFLSEELPAEPIDPLASVPNLVSDFTDPDDASAATPCTRCGGRVGADGYCLACGAQLNDRDHVTASGKWFGAVSDRGLVHHRNEDAFAISGRDELGSFATLVVCDGVSMSARSDEASAAAANAALDKLEELGQFDPVAALHRATDAANQAVLQIMVPDEPQPPSCTLVAGVVLRNEAWLTSVGDSRAYWVPDSGIAMRITTDHSLASYAISTGMSEEEAEHSPGAHTLTAWIGPDSPVTQADVYHLLAKQPGWLILCSDGLWNYASAADELATLVRETAMNVTGSSTSDEGAKNGTNPTRLAADLVVWANAQGGHDNITVVMARLIDEG